MFPCRVFLLVLPVIGGVCGSYSQASELIRRIYNDGASKAAYFIAPEPKFVGSFMRGYSDVPVMTTTTGLGERITDVVILIVSDEGVDEEILERVIKRLRVRKYVVITASGNEALHQRCAYFAKWKFSRIFGSVQGVAYAYHNFADRLLPIASLNDPLPNAQRDLHGRHVRTTAQTDFPRVLRYPDSEGRLRIGGQYALIFLRFLKTYNGTFREIIVTNSSFLDCPAIWKGIMEDRIDVSINSFAVGNDTDFTVSYPIHMQRWTIMVPISGYLNPDQYFLRPFTLTVWACIGGSFLYIVFMDVLKDLADGRTPNPWRCFSQTLLMMLNMSADGIIGGAARIHVLIVLYSFILVNFYLNHLTSFLTVFIPIKQYDTMQELVDNKVHFIVPDFLWAHAAQTGELPPNLQPIAHCVEFADFIAQLMQMSNTSVSYAIGQDRAEFLIGLQSLSGKPRFRLISDYIGIVHTGFMMEPHLPYSEVLDYFIMRCWAVGLVQKFGLESITQATKSGFRVAPGISHKESAKPLTWHDLRFAWSSLAGGLTLALAAFVLEVCGRFVKSRLFVLRNRRALN